MRILSLKATGRYHPYHCEDHLFHQYLGSRYLVAAVMDGCSSGVETYFASTLYAKSLRKSCSMLPNMKEIFAELDMQIMDKEAVGNFILGQLFEDVKKIKKTLFLEIQELLSTVLLLVFDLHDQSAWLSVSGDGVVLCNGEMQEFDQNNMPDYLAYHLDIKFDQWLNQHTKTYSYEKIKDIAISTDGILKLKKQGPRVARELNVMEQLLVEVPYGSGEAELQHTFQRLMQEESYIPYDDIGILRLIP